MKAACCLVAALAGAACESGSVEEKKVAPPLMSASIQGNDVKIVLSAGETLQQHIRMPGLFTVDEGARITEIEGKLGKPQRQWKDARGKEWASFAVAGGSLEAGTETEIDGFERMERWAVSGHPDARKPEELFSDPIAALIGSNPFIHVVVVDQAGASVSCVLQNRLADRCSWRRGSS